MAQSPGEVDTGTVPTAHPTQAAGVPSTTDIRSQVSQTRAEMSETIDAIQARLSPRRAIADATDAMTDATKGRLTRLAHRTNDACRRLVVATRANPVPMALLAAAAFGLILRALNTRHRRPHASNAAGNGKWPRTEGVQCERP